MCVTTTLARVTSSTDVVRSPRVRQVFRTLAFAEAVSWAALLVAMFFKWIVQDDPEAGIEGGVPVAGPIHGALFVAYCVAALVAWRAYGWTFRTLVLALLASSPPFFTGVCEVVADRRGLLGRPARG